MPKVIHHHVTTQTMQGEVTINLNLTITIDQDGSISVSTKNKEAVIPELKNDNPLFAIPDFEATEDLLDFGKDSSDG